MQLSRQQCQSNMSTSEQEMETRIPSQQFAPIMEAITSSQARMEEKFAEFKSKMQQGEEDAAVKRARYEKPYSFKRKGNEEQATFNSKIDESIAEAKA